MKLFTRKDLKKPIVLLFCILLCSLSLPLWAKDWGIILEQSAGYSDTGSGSQPEYIGIIIPRFSHLWDTNRELYISAGLNAEYANDNWNFAPELLRTEFTWVLSNAELKAGRMHYSDPLGFIAEGLFDGGRFSYITDLGTFSFGVWYTGFLYNRRANITMTSRELESYETQLDYNDFANTYFAPSRLLSALDWEHPGLMNGLFRGQLSLLAQFDLSDEALHTQYLTGKLSFPLNPYQFDIGGSFALIQYLEETHIMYAAELAVFWTLPFSFPSRLSFLGRYSSGISENRTTMAFLPLTTKQQGSVIEANTPGTSMLSLEYLVRLQETVSASLSSSYFIRNDLYTYAGYPIGPATDSGHFLGNEFFGRLYWNPFTDLALNLGAGIFLPSLGDVEPDADIIWRINLNLILSIR